MSTYFYGFTALTGGAAGCLDAIDGDLLVNQDIAVGVVSGFSYIYDLVATSGAATNSPFIIPPATNPGNKRWKLRGIYSNNCIQGFSTTPTAAGTTTLDVSSTYQQFFTGSSTQIVLLPVVTTLVNGHSFMIVNLSSDVVTVKTSGANVVQAMAANSSLVVTCVDVTGGTGVASWSWSYQPWLKTFLAAIANGGTGQTTAQNAINALTAVAGATNEHVLTKDTATGNAIFKAATGGGMGTDPLWDAAGDLAVGTGANTGGRLAIGTTGQIPISNGTTLAYGVAEDVSGGTQARRSTSDLSKSNSTSLADIVGLTVDLAAGKTYAFRATVFYTSGSSGGAKIAVVAGGTITSTQYYIAMFDYSTLTIIASASKNSFNSTTGLTATTAGYFEISGTVVANGAGTLYIRGAQNASNGTATHFIVGSSWVVTECTS
jgi:hypothetical protein